jgi:glycosyltransferase involved in cell wall biosynthesis
MKTIFIFAYYSFKDPIFQSAILPYFTDFPEKKSYRFILLTFEQERYRSTATERVAIKKSLAEHNIIWFNTNWHSGKFKLIKKAFDFTYGMLLSLALIVRFRAKIIYSEGFPGAIFGHYLSKMTGCKHVVHTFEPHADYMVEAGVWKKTDWEAKLLYRLQDKVAKGASDIMTATDAMKDRLRNVVSKKTKIHRVPSCVDLDHFCFSDEGRNEVRRRLAIDSGEIVLVYIGKFGGMYMEHELFDFFQVCESKAINFKYWIFTPDDQAQVYSHFEHVGIPKEKYTVDKLTRDQIPDYLSAADFGLVPVRQFPGKRFCSPIKDGEYWACGLPIIIPEGISDDYLIAQSENIGLVYKDASQSSYETLVKKIIYWAESKDKSEVRRRCRDFAEKDRSVARFKVLYHQVFSDY